MPMTHRACGVRSGCSNCGVWHVAVISVLRYTPPSEEKIVGQRSFGTDMSKTRSPVSSCAPVGRVNEPTQLFAVGQRGPATNDVHVARYRPTSPHQRSKTSLAPAFERWFVTTNGMRPCAALATLNSRAHVAPASSDSKNWSPATRKITFGSSGDAAIEHGPPGRPAEVSAAAGQFAPPSVERNTP